VPSFTHDVLVMLFKNRPTLAPELLRDVLHVAVPAFQQARVGDATLTARLRCDVALLAVTPEASVAGWAAAPIATGHPGWVLVPLVLGPDTVPVIRDAEVATLAPELAVLSVMLHGRGEHAVAVGEAALAAARGLGEGRDILYTDPVLASVHDAARAILEAVMASGNCEYQSDFARRYFGQGKAEGLAEAVLAVLGARQIAVPDEIRARIATCADLGLLDRWLARAVTAHAAADVVCE
jgi:hypothetical protein